MASRFVLPILLVLLDVGIAIQAADPDKASEPRAVRVLLLGQKNDSHPRATHEYMAGQRILARLLERQAGLHVVVIQADSPWTEGPELLDGADGAVLYLTEGAKWVSDDPDRLAAFQRMAKRKAGLCCLHWGMGSRETEPVQAYADLFGGCHGGPDRKYKVDDFQLVPAAEPHPVTSRIVPFKAHDELYYALKVPKGSAGLTSLITVQVGDSKQTVSWGWDRPDGGRSFGFSGLHFHENWKRAEYRRLVTQGVLWTLRRPIPAGGLNVDLATTDLSLPDDPVK